VIEASPDVMERRVSLGQMEFQERQDLQEILDTSEPRACRETPGLPMETSSSAKEEMMEYLDSRVWTGSLDPKVFVVLTETRDQRVRMDPQDPEVPKGKWDKESTDQKEERGNLVPLVPRGTPDPLSIGTAMVRQ